MSIGVCVFHPFWRGRRGVDPDMLHREAVGHPIQLDSPSREGNIVVSPRRPESSALWLWSSIRTIHIEMETIWQWEWQMMVVICRMFVLR